jgi:hypothetical protein
MPHDSNAMSGLRDLADDAAKNASRFAPERADLEAQRRKLKRMYEDTATDSPADRDRRRTAIRDMTIVLDEAESRYERIERRMTATPLPPDQECDLLRAHNDILRRLLWRVLREWVNIPPPLQQTITEHLRVPKLR